MSKKIFTRLLKSFIALCILSPIIGMVIGIYFCQFIPIIIGLAIPYIIGAIFLPFIIVMIKRSKDK